MYISFKQQLLTLIDKPILFNTFKKIYIKDIDVTLPDYSSSGDWNEYYWNNIFSNATFYIHFIYDKERNSYDVSGYRFDKDGCFKNYQTGKFLHEEFKNYITMVDDMRLYELLIKEIIIKWGLCPLTAFPVSNKHRIIDIMNAINYFDNYTIQDRLDFYEKTNNPQYLSKEIIDVFVF